METKDVIAELRTKEGLTQEELAGRLSVTRQAVSRWEMGETTPNIETLKQLSIMFNVSINTLLGSPNKLICQCCGMPLDDASISREPDGAFNEEYCKWCYTDGKFVYTNIGELIDFLAEQMTNDNCSKEQARTFLEEQLPKLKHWSAE
ncbi:MAG: helix-turn-helix domain-containing protein [Lachnospiraceae bacterium]